MALNHALTRAGLALAGSAEPPDVVHAHDWLVAHAAITLKHHLRVPLVATLHATEAGRHQGWLPGAAEPLDPLGGVVADVRGAPGAHLLVVHALGGDPAVRPAAGQGRRGAQRGGPASAGGRSRSGSRRRGAGGPATGRWSSSPGGWCTRRACTTCSPRSPGCAGGTPESGWWSPAAGRRTAELRELARRLRLGRSVSFAGFVPDAELAALVAAADCAVVPPVRAVRAGGARGGGGRDAGGGSDVGGLPEFVEHGSTGLRFPAGDPAALAARWPGARRTPAARPRPRPPPASRPPPPPAPPARTARTGWAPPRSRPPRRSAASSASGTKPAKRTAPAEPQPPGQLPQLVRRRPAAGDHQPDAGVPPAQPGERGEQVVHALLVHQPSGEDDQRPVAGPPAPRRGDPLRERPPAPRVDPVGHHVDLVRRQVEQPGHLPAHVRRAGDHPARLVRQPPLHRVDRAVQRAGQPALVPAGLGRVQGGDQRHAAGGA